MRTRWVTFVGSFVALALGAGLLAMTGLALAATFDAPDRSPERFAAAPVVVAPSDTLRVATSVGERTARLTDPRPVPRDLADGLSALGPTAEDRTFPVRTAGTDAVGHPWSVAATTPYRLLSGRAPAREGEVVVTADAGPGRGPRVGDRIGSPSPAPRPRRARARSSARWRPRISRRRCSSVTPRPPVSTRPSTPWPCTPTRTRYGGWPGRSPE